jgi:hypothetical protein
LLLSAGAALAQGPPVVKVTERLVNEPTTDIGVHPCTRQPAGLTLVESGVIHFRAFADGTVHFTGGPGTPEAPFCSYPRVRLLKRQLHQGAPGITRTRDSLGAFSSRYAETCACHTASPPSCWQWPSRSWGPAAGARTLPCSPQRLSVRRPGNPALRGPCASWLGVGVAAAYCANGHEAPAPNTGDQSVGEVRFTGLKRSAAGGGISQGVGTLPEGGTIGLEVRGETAGTLLARGMCEGMMVKAAFYDQRFTHGAKGTISIERADDVPVIVLRLDGEIIAPDREVVGDLSWLPAQDKQLCAFAVQ